MRTKIHGAEPTAASLEISGRANAGYCRRGLIFQVAARMATVIRPVTIAAIGTASASDRRRRPSDRGKGFGEGRQPRRGLAAAKLAAPRLHPKPELDRGGGGRREYHAIAR